MIALALLLMFQQPPQTAPAPAATPPAGPAAPAQVAAPQAAPAAPTPVAAPVPTTLMQVRAVYLLPMGSAFDQYLANQLVRTGLFEVVTDPARADAIFTDRLGRSFEKQMEKLYPSPKPEPEPKPKQEPEEEIDPQKTPSFDLKSEDQERVSAFGRGKGTFFLVGRGVRSVVWSTYEKPKSTRPEDLDESAKNVAIRLQNAIKKQAGEIEKASKAGSGDR